SLAIERAKRLFGAEHVNVQPHSGAQANMAVYFSILKVGDKILTMNLAHGGHLTHGHPANFSGKFYQVTHYGVSEKTEQIDYDTLEKLANETRPGMAPAGSRPSPRAFCDEHDTQKPSGSTWGNRHVSGKIWETDRRHGFPRRPRRSPHACDRRQGGLFPRGTATAVSGISEASCDKCESTGRWLKQTRLSHRQRRH